MHRLNQGNCILHWRQLHDAVSQVENMPRTTADLIDNSFGPPANFGFIGQQHQRIEVALYRSLVADRSPGVVEPHAPIDANHLPAGLGHQRQ